MGMTVGKLRHRLLALHPDTPVVILQPAGAGEVVALVPVGLRLAAGPAVEVATEHRPDPDDDPTADVLSAIWSSGPQAVS